jgi:hypothetical protein
MIGICARTELADRRAMGGGVAITPGVGVFTLAGDTGKLEHESGTIQQRIDEGGKPFPRSFSVEELKWS